MYLTVRAIVLRVTEFNDRDALLTVLTQNYGKLTIKARGLRRKNSPLVAPCQLLAYGEFTLFEYRGKYTINEAHALELFQGLRRELTKLSLGSYFAQVAEKHHVILISSMPEAWFRQTKIHVAATAEEALALACRLNGGNLDGLYTALLPSGGSVLPVLP